MRLTKLVLENYQGIKYTEFTFDGESMAIKGKNATGKTTIANAYSWLLTDKPINGEKGYTPKTREGDGEAHHLDHSVEAEFIKDDEGYFKLKKVFHEKWTKKRGQAADEFSGHVVDYYIDDVPVKMKDFNEFINSVTIDQATLQLLLNVDAFANMKWQDRRALLLELCGDVTDETIIDSVPELHELNDILSNGSRMYSVDEYMAKAKSEMRKLNKEIDSGIPQRINEAKMAIPDGADSIDREDSKAKVKSLEEQKNILMAKKNELIASAQDDLVKNQLKEIESRIVEARLKYRSDCATKEFEWQQKRREFETAVSNAQSLVDSTERSIRNSEADLKYSESRRTSLIAQWKNVNASRFEGDTICPTCGQPLPPEQVNEAKERFNLEKSKKLEEINAMGKAVSMDSINEQKQFIEKLNADLKVYGTDLVLARKKLTEFETSRPLSLPFEESEAYLELTAEKNALSSADKNEMINSQLKTIDASINEIKQKIDEHKQKLFMADVYDRQTERVAELEDELRSKAIAFEQLQKGVFLCEEFVKAKVEYTDKAIADVFKTVKFRMFETQINGGLKSCCDVMVPDGKGNYVPYASANNAARIRAGLEIIKVLGDHFDVHVPVFIDNAEGIDHAIEEEGMQIISLLVDRSDDDDMKVITL